MSHTRCAALAACMLVGTAGAEVYFGTYRPSQLDPSIVSRNDPFPYALRDLDGPSAADVTADYDSYFTLINIWGTAFSRNAVYQEFVAPVSFSATHISLGVSRTFVATDTLVGLAVQRWNADAGAWENLYDQFAGARIRAGGIPGNGQMMDLSVAFGSNGTGSPVWFNSTPATIEAGERYRLVVNGIAGGQGGFNWHLSTTADTLDAVGYDDDPMSGPGNSGYSRGYNANNNTPLAMEWDSQFAFAFTDGNPVPAPAAGGMIGLAALSGARRRR